MSWGADTILELRREGIITPEESGTMPTPGDLATAMDQCADLFEGSAFAMSGNPDPLGPTELRWLASEIGDGTPTGRASFRSALLDVVGIKRCHRQAGGVTRFLPVDVLAPFVRRGQLSCPGHHWNRQVLPKLLCSPRHLGR